MEIIELKAYAKINLGLEVLYKRPDGFHEINTVFTRVNLFDRLTIAPAGVLSVDCSPGLNIPEKENIVYKTASKIQKDFNLKRNNAKITVNKNIPSGAGLGGGSSDAATALVGLNKFWDLNASDDYLLAAASTLGSDVPFFLCPSSASATGRGESLTPFEFTLPWWVVIVYPDIHVSTPLAYSALKRDGNPRPSKDFVPAVVNSIGDPGLLKDCLVNDFEDVVFAQYPQIGLIKEKMYGQGAFFALMSGSGSSVYGLFFDKQTATVAKESFDGLTSFLCEPF